MLTLVISILRRYGRITGVLCCPQGGDSQLGTTNCYPSFLAEHPTTYSKICHYIVHHSEQNRVHLGK